MPENDFFSEALESFGHLQVTQVPTIQPESTYNDRYMYALSIYRGAKGALYAWIHVLRGLQGN